MTQAESIPRKRPAASRQWLFLAGGLVFAFAIPFVFTDLLTIDRDLYYGVYSTAVFGLFFLWLRPTAGSIRATLTRSWRRAALLSLVFGAALVAVALRDHPTAHPPGWTLVGAVVWRGVMYGAADGLLLSAFPILAVFAAFGSRPLAERSKRAILGVGTLALAASLAFTAVYHVGYADFRGAKVRKPIAGDLIWSAPTLLTLNPVGAPVAHIAMHVAAVVHSYDTQTFLPPHR
jgi:hypothetical protein